MNSVSWVLFVSALLCLRFRSLLLPFLVMSGLAWAVFFSQQRLEHRLPAALEGQLVRVSGEIKSLPDYQQEQVTFLYEVSCLSLLDSSDTEETAADCLPGPQLLRLSWYQSAPETLRVGERWSLDVKLKRPHGFANPGGFDYERWLFAQGIDATGSVFNRGQPQRVEQPLGLSMEGWPYPLRSINQWRQDLAETINNSAVSAEARVFLSALTLGDQRGIQSYHYQVLNQTGTLHLLAVSGLHVTLVAGFVYWMGLALLKRLPRLSQRFVAQKLAVLISFLVGTFYCLLAGFSLPTFRAWLILLCFSLHFFSERSQSPWQAFCVSLLLVCLLQPLAVLDASLWLSFAAVAVILLLLTSRVRQRKVIASAEQATHSRTKLLMYQGRRYLQADWRLQWALFVGLLPLLWILYGQVSLIAPFFNMLAVPFVSWLVVPPALLALLMLPLYSLDSNFLFLAAAKGMDLFWLVARWLAEQKVGLWYLPGIDSWFATVCLVVACLLYLLPKNFPGRWLGFFLMLPVVFDVLFASRVSELLNNVQSTRSHILTTGDLDMNVLDVGQGLAVVFATQHHLLVYDTGPSMGPQLDAGIAVLAPYFHYQGIRRVDTLVLSHADDDHIGGATSVLGQFPVKHVFAWPGAEPVLSQRAAFEKSIVQECKTPHYWQWDGVHFLLFSWASFGHESNSDNNSSCLLKVWTEKFSVLVPGDIEKPVEYSVFNDFAYWVGEYRYPFNLKADLLIAPHHGSASSSTSYFIQNVAPKQVVFSAAYRSRFGHPHPTVVARYEQNHVRHFNTADSGRLFYSFRSDLFDKQQKNDFPEPQVYRATHRHFWQISD